MCEDVSFEKKYPSIFIKIEKLEISELPYHNAKKIDINDGKFIFVIHNSLVNLFIIGKTHRIWYRLPDLNRQFVEVLCVADIPDCLVKR